MWKKLCLFVACFCAMTNFIVVLPKADGTDIPSEEEIFGQSALLMDADSGRVLWEKNGQNPLPMASTTKIMTCLVALERGDLKDVVTVSVNAAAQPDVQMNIASGEQYLLEDLLYGMMLESYNDVAVAVAEHIGQTVEGFAALMDEKALEIGCKDTHFVTPNGLDGEDAQGIHHTTAEDLARILSCAVQNQEFLTITSTLEHTISECDGKRNVTATNKNALLRTMDGAISGKTGFTGKAGFCYAGAVKREDITLVAITLGSGWPPHKTYKWQDMNQLFAYGFSAFRHKTFQLDLDQCPKTIQVKNGQGENLFQPAYGQVEITAKPVTLLLKEEDEFEVELKMEECIMAPGEKGQQVGQVIYTLSGELYETTPILLAQSVLEINYWWCMEELAKFALI